MNLSLIITVELILKRNKEDQRSRKQPDVGWNVICEVKKIT
jgi:hypothetical protein